MNSPSRWQHSHGVSFAEALRVWIRVALLSFGGPAGQIAVIAPIVVLVAAVGRFVGFMAAYRNPGAIDPMVAGILASLLVTWVTFAPSFLWIFLGAPYIEYLRNNRRLNHALSAITAAVVGVVLNLAIWFSLHALFSDVEEIRRFGFRFLIPEWATLDPAAAVLTVGALVATFRFKLGIIPTLAGSVVLGVAWFLLARG